MDAWAYAVITLIIGIVIIVTAFSTASTFLMVITMINLVGLILACLVGVEIYGKYATVEEDVNDLKVYRGQNEQQITNLITEINMNDQQLKAAVDNLIYGLTNQNQNGAMV